MRGVLALRLSPDEKAALARAAKAKGVPLSSFVREAALAAVSVSGSDQEEPQTVSRASENMRQVRESPAEIMARAWERPVPWRERGVDPADGHRHSNVESVPGSFAHPITWPPIGPPSEPG
jgi:uncharacterized protein (DUF1778 family)